MSEDSSVLRQRRGFLVSALGGAAAAMLVGTRSARAAGASNLLSVGAGGEFSTLQAALAAINDNSPSNGYLVTLLPGVHGVPAGGLSLKPYVSIDGCGQGITELACSGTSVLRAATGVKLSNMTLSGNFTSPNHGPGIITDASQLVLDFRLENVSMYVTGGHGAAVSMTRFNTCFFDNIDVYTTSVGFAVGGYCHLDGVRLFLSGTATGTPYIGLYVPGSGRTYLWATKIVTGYGSADRAGFGDGLEVVNDPSADVLAIYIPASNQADPRVECHGLNSYARNEIAVASTRVHCVLAEAGRVRLYGGLQQAETPALNRATLVQAGTGIIETSGARFSGARGNIWDTNTTGTWKTDVSSNNLRLPDESGAVVLCDASGGPYTLRLPGSMDHFRNGIRFIFVKTDGTPNRVTITGGQLNISGAPTRLLSAPYARMEVIGTEAEWLLI